MTNRLDLSLPPQDLFLLPDSDAGLSPIAEPEFTWRPRARARTPGFAASGYEPINRRLEQHITQTARHRSFSRAVEFNTIPAVLEGAEFRKSFVTAGGKALLSGAAGTRLLNRYLWHHEDAGDPADDRLADWFTAAQDRGIQTALARPCRDTVLDLPFAVEARNTFNFYHFTTESLCQFCMLDELGHDRPLFLHHPDSPEKTRAFTREFLTTLFPEFGHKVRFERSPKAYDRVIAPFHLKHAYYQYGDDAIAPVDALVQGKDLWTGRRATNGSMSVLSMNTVDTNLYRLRERGLAAIAGKDFSHLPRRFWVSRKPGLARARGVRGEEELQEFLRPLGFQTVYLEDLSPLDQIGLVAHAECMISGHGAAFAHMLFASPKALMIEIATLQIALLMRTGDFWRAAHVSGCTYASFYADHDQKDPLAEPEADRMGVVPPALSRAGLANMAAFLVANFGPMPRFQTGAPLLRLARQLNAIGAHDRTLALMALHRGAEQQDADLCLALADAYRHTEQDTAELSALCDAYRLQPDRGFTLVQITYAARKSGDEAVLRWALSELGRRFPQRLADLLRSRPGLRQLAS